MLVLAQRPEVYFRAPTLSELPDGAVALDVREWRAGRESTRRYRLDADGTCDMSSAVDAPQSRGEDDARVSAGAWTAECLRDSDGIARVRIVHDSWASPRVVWASRALAAAPSLAPTPTGAWLAFHHDRREDDATRDVTKWIDVGFMQLDGTWRRLLGPLPDLDRDREGEEQGFEFPTLVVGSGGALRLYGRGSHRFWRQELRDDHLAPRVALGTGEWGCRGRRVAALRTSAGVVWTARREKAGIVVEIDPPIDGAAPALERASPRIDAVGETPAVVSNRRLVRDGHTWLFGDLHQHSAHSDGCGAAHEAYDRARHHYGDDFAALTDHESFLGKRVGPGEWAELAAVTDRANDPGKFVALHAYEWTARMHPGPGHKCVYVPSGDVPIFSRDVVPEGAELVRRLRDAGGICAPHHVGWTGADADAHDEVIQPVWEICSCHGCYEFASHPLGQRGELFDQLVDAMLRRGLRFGFIAASDSHGLLWHHGIARKRDPFRTGLTAVLATEATREAIFAALRARRCYATSGAKILLDVRAGVDPMGAVVHGDMLELAVRGSGTDTIEHVDLVGPDGLLDRIEGRGSEFAFERTISAAYVYARVVQRDGEMAWSSPIFLDSTAER